MKIITLEFNPTRNYQIWTEDEYLNRGKKHKKVPF